MGAAKRGAMKGRDKDTERSDADTEDDGEREEGTEGTQKRTRFIRPYKGDGGILDFVRVVARHRDALALPEKFFGSGLQKIEDKCELVIRNIDSRRKCEATIALHLPELKSVNLNYKLGKEFSPEERIAHKWITAYALLRESWNLFAETFPTFRGQEFLDVFAKLADDHTGMSGPVVNAGDVLWPSVLSSCGVKRQSMSKRRLNGTVNPAREAQSPAMVANGTAAPMAADSDATAEIEERESTPPSSSESKRGRSPPAEMGYDSDGLADVLSELTEMGGIAPKRRSPAVAEPAFMAHENGVVTSTATTSSTYDAQASQQEAHETAPTTVLRQDEGDVNADEQQSEQPHNARPMEACVRCGRHCRAMVTTCENGHKACVQCFDVIRDCACRALPIGDTGTDVALHCPAGDGHIRVSKSRHANELIIGEMRERARVVRGNFHALYHGFERRLDSAIDSGDPKVINVALAILEHVSTFLQ